MAEKVCVHCGSKYVDYKGRTVERSTTVDSYYCNSCKKSFTVQTSNQTSGVLIARFEHDGSFGKIDYIEVYSDGTNISVFQCDDGKKLNRQVSPKVYYKKEDNGRQFLWATTFQNPYDSSGSLLIVERFILSPELTKLALQYEAMRAVYSSADQKFWLKGIKNDAILKDVATWLQINLGLNTIRPKEGCYVATAVYGSYDCPEVWILRRYRDDTLSKTWYGRAFIHTYYAISPTLVKWFGNTAWFKNMWKPKLDKMVERLNSEGVSDKPYNDKNW